jgi:hypothetical protein
MGRRGWAFGGAAMLGLATGWMLAQRRIGTHRQDLFSGRPLRRLAALGFLAGREEIETVRLLRDYLAWERQPMLRRRAESILKRMETAIGAGTAR